MKMLLYLLLLSPLGLIQAPAADTERITYYVQLVRGNNEEKSPDAASKPIGPKLSNELRRVFAWKSYWEVSRHQVEVHPSRKAKVKLSADREVEIDLSVSGKRKVIAYSEGKPISEITRPAGQKMTIIGGDRDKHSAWFIVVRRDKPSED
jgi:hypothetical protein